MHRYKIYFPYIKILKFPNASEKFKREVHRIPKQKGLILAYDVPNICNNLPDFVCSATSFFSFEKKFRSYLFVKAYSPGLILILRCFLCGTNLYLCPGYLIYVLYFYYPPQSLSLRYRLKAIKAQLEY